MVLENQNSTIKAYGRMLDFLNTKARNPSMDISNYIKVLELHDQLIKSVMTSFLAHAPEQKHAMIDVSRPVSDLDCVFIGFISSPQFFCHHQAFITLFCFYKHFIAYLVGLEKSTQGTVVIDKSDLEMFNTVFQKFFWAVKAVVEPPEKAAHLSDSSNNSSCVIC